MDELAFLEEGAVKAAKKLIGWRFYKEGPNGPVGGVITETEAYTQDDAASHCYRGKTSRNEIMFGPAGHLYVYFTYGMHYCVNIVTGKLGQGDGVLIRALLPDEGIEVMRQRRGSKPDLHLSDGPAKICQALEITRADNGLAVNRGQFSLLPPNSRLPKVKTTTRIGIKKDTHRLWRFVVTQL